LLFFHPEQIQATPLQPKRRQKKSHSLPIHRFNPSYVVSPKAPPPKQLRKMVQALHAIFALQKIQQLDSINIVRHFLNEAPANSRTPCNLEHGALLSWSSHARYSTISAFSAELTAPLQQLQKISLLWNNVQIQFFRQPTENKRNHMNRRTVLPETPSTNECRRFIQATSFLSTHNQPANPLARAGHLI
jgi:hypothetical protein